MTKEPVDIIQILPDAVANQIAAGEVIQRPSSAVKELIENSIDSGADQISVVIRDAGRTLIQVTDNGCGMSETDARMCFERHATSKIRQAADLFAIRSFGFRGEALASIAAVAQVELKTRTKGKDLGTLIHAEGARVISQDYCACPEGTSISVRNLFYNVPARRKFLKSDASETRHIIQEFHHAAIIHPEIQFLLVQNDKTVYQLGKTNLKQRIMAIFGPVFKNRLISMDEDSPVVRLSGYIGKPEFARKTRGEQFFFVNRRFIRHPYLNHAVENAFQELLPSRSFPSYFIHLDVDPGTIDINIHPTKTEINFQNAQVIYSLIRSSVKKALGQFNLDGTIDFDKEKSMDFGTAPSGRVIRQPTVTINPDYDPFKTVPRSGHEKSESQRSESNLRNWEKLYRDDHAPGEEKESGDHNSHTLSIPSSLDHENEPGHYAPDSLALQLHNHFIVTVIKSGLMVIDQQRAHERILYERFLNQLQSRKEASQQQLFPETITLTAEEAVIMNQISDELRCLGFDIGDFGGHTFIIRGIPAGMNNDEVKDVLEIIIENFKQNLSELKNDKMVNLAKSSASGLAIRSGKKLQPEEIMGLIHQLFACQVPEISPGGLPVLKIITMEDLLQLFRK
ncbi:MAG: DNA mismatch repair endonuclease MutL [Bacteroidales bacterium]|nr:DNA mismatch repair endonuclease MutL [Bacteroidales bacterium]